MCDILCSPSIHCTPEVLGVGFGHSHMNVCKGKHWQNGASCEDMFCRALCFSLCGSRERMEAMEKQIASLTGLLQRVLSRAPEAESP